MLYTHQPHFYSQYGEDELLWKLFGEQEDGFFVDVGAFDGVHLSNTFSFEQRGWHGICIEPHPQYFPLCEFSRPHSICINCAAGSTSGNVDFWIEELGLLSGIDVDNDEIKTRYDARGLLFNGSKHIIVAVNTLNAILQKNMPPNTTIDFVSIDVEGTEMEVLKGFDIGHHQPRVLLIEANTASQRLEVTAYLHTKGYELARQVGPNCFFVRQLHDIDRLMQLTIDGRSEMHQHPLGTKYTPVRCWKGQPFPDITHEFLKSE